MCILFTLFLSLHKNSSSAKEKLCLKKKVPRWQKRNTGCVINCYHLELQ